MNARDDILHRIRAALDNASPNQRDEQRRVAAEAELAAAIAARKQGPRPCMAVDLTKRFRRNSERMASTVADVATPADVPAAVARYLDEHGIARRTVIWPALADLDWPVAGIAAEARPARDDDLVGITGCFCALAETGTLMLCAGPDAPAATSLLPETHIAVVPASRIVAGMEEGWALARSKFGTLPRAVNFISGPSRTGDIEQTIVIGAHGPCRVHLILVTDA